MKELLRYKNILASIIIIVAFTFTAKTLWKKYTLELATLKAKMEALEKGKETIEQWNALSVQYDKVAKDFFAKDESLFKKFVEQKTKSSGINVNYLSPSRKSAGFYTEVSFALRASSDSYSNILNFVKALEERKIIIESLRVRNSGNKRSADITVKSFILED